MIPFLYFTGKFLLTVPSCPSNHVRILVNIPIYQDTKLLENIYLRKPSITGTENQLSPTSNYLPPPTSQNLPNLITKRKIFHTRKIVLCDINPPMVRLVVGMSMDLDLMMRILGFHLVNQGNGQTMISRLISLRCGLIRLPRLLLEDEKFRRIRTIVILLRVVRISSVLSPFVRATYTVLTTNPLLPPITSLQPRQMSPSRETH